VRVCARECVCVCERDGENGNDVVVLWYHSRVCVRYVRVYVCVCEGMCRRGVCVHVRV